MGYWYGGVSFIKNGTVTDYGKPEGLPSDAVLAFARDRQGAIWIAALGTEASVTVTVATVTSSQQRHRDGHVMSPDRHSDGDSDGHVPRCGRDRFSPFTAVESTFASASFR